MRPALLMVLLTVLPTLAGCQKDFDTQYAETEKQLQNDAKRLDRQMAKEAAKEPRDVR